MIMERKFLNRSYGELINDQFRLVYFRNWFNDSQTNPIFLLKSTEFKRKSSKSFKVLNLNQITERNLTFRKLDPPSQHPSMSQKNQILVLSGHLEEMDSNRDFLNAFKTGQEPFNRFRNGYFASINNFNLFQLGTYFSLIKSKS